MTTDPTLHPDLLLIVPAAGSRALAHIAPGSVIVGTPEGDGVLCYYEGGIYNPRATWDEMLQIAAGRLTGKAPTSAIVFAPASDVAVVGIVRRDDLIGGWTVSSIDDPATLAAWRPQGGYVEGRSSEMLRAAVGRLGHKAHSPRAHDAYKAALGAGRSLDEAYEALLQAK